jgi:hypothetical protein
MSPRKLAIVILIVIVILDILRESGVITFDRYKYELTGHLDAKWDGQTISVDHKGDSSFAALSPKLENPCNYNGSIKNVPIIVRYKNDYAGKIDTGCIQLNITIVSFEPGLIWTPLYKNTAFTVKAVSNDMIRLYHKGDADVITETEYQLPGTFEYRGRLKIYGLCTYREARRLLLEQMLDALLDAGQNRINKY